MVNRGGSNLKKRLLTGLLAFSLVLEGTVMPLYAEETAETVLETEVSETVETEIAETQMQTESEAAAETKTETVPETETELSSLPETEMPAPAYVQADADLKAFRNNDDNTLALVFKAFGEDKTYHYTIYSAESGEQLQTGDLETKPYEQLLSAVVRLDEKQFGEDVKAFKVELVCGDSAAQVLVDDSVKTADELASEATQTGDIQIHWDAVKADAYAVLALAEDEVVLYETVEETMLKMPAPEEADSYTVLMTAIEEPEAEAEETLVAFSPAVTVKIAAADVQIPETEAQETAAPETEKETAAVTETQAEEPVLIKAADTNPKAATNLKAKGYESFAKLSWTEGDNTTGNRVWVFDAETGKRIWQSFETGTTCEIPDLETDHEYQFRLRAYKVVKGEKVFGAMTKMVSFKTAHYVPRLPENVKVRPGETTAKITWTKGLLANGYYVWVFDVATGKRVFGIQTTGTSCNVSGLTIGKEYKYFLRGYRTVDGKEYYGDYSTSQRFKTDYIVPARATGLKAKAGDKSVTLTWKKAAYATHYLVKMVNYKTGKTTSVGRTRNLTFTVDDLNNNQEYGFRVISYRYVNKHNTYAKSTAWVKAKPVLQAPDAPTSLEVVYTDAGNVLTWSKVKYANGYAVYSFDFDKGEYVKQATVTTNTWTDKGNGEAGKFRYYVKAFRREGGRTLYGTGISKLVYGNQDLLAAAEIHPILYSGVINQNTTLYKESSGSASAGTISAGTNVTVSYRVWHGRNRIILSDGSVYWITNSHVRCTSDHYTSKDYTKSAKETFINNTGYSSSSNYFVWVSTYTQRVNIFTGSQGNWKLLLTTPCATGVVATFTPHGSGILKSHERTHYAEYSYYEWLTYFTSGNAFHTRIKKNSDGSFRSKTLGKPMSGGCVRVMDDIARMIYYDIPLQTGELIY